MTLIVEDGSIRTGANSYVDLDYARSFALERGIILSTVDATLEAELIKSKDFLESKRSKYKGNKTTSTQSLQFPRIGLSIDNYLVDSNMIPNELKFAQVQGVIDIENGVDLMPTSTDRPIVRETVGPITTVYSDKYGSMSKADTTKLNEFLKPLLKSTSVFLTQRV